jgi:hypothetical protein
MTQGANSYNCLLILLTADEMYTSHLHALELRGTAFLPDGSMQITGRMLKDRQLTVNSSFPVGITKDQCTRLLERLTSFR